MIIPLLAVSGLQGMNNSSKDTLTLALDHCIDSESYRLKYALRIDEKRQRRVAIHYFNSNDEQYSSDDKIKKIVAGSLKRIFVESFAKILTIQLLPEGTVLSEDHNEWLVNRRRDDKRTIVCMFYNISNNNRSMRDHIQKIRLMLGLGTPFLVNINSSVTGVLDILDVLGKDVKVFGELPLDVLMEQVEKIIKKLDSEAKNLNDRDSMTKLNLIKERVEKLQVDAKSFNKSQPGYINTFKNFFINHRGKLAGVFSLTVLLVYYYKFVR